MPKHCTILVFLLCLLERFSRFLSLVACTLRNFINLRAFLIRYSWKHTKIRGCFYYRRDWAVIVPYASFFSLICSISLSRSLAFIFISWDAGPVEHSLFVFRFLAFQYSAMFWYPVSGLHSIDFCLSYHLIVFLSSESISLARKRRI